MSSPASGPTANSTGAVTGRALSPHPSQQMLVGIRQQHHSIMYPVASSGRGFIPKSIRPDQAVTVAYPPRPVNLPYHRPPPPPAPPLHFVRPPAPLPHLPASLPIKVAPSPASVADSNGYKHHREETLITVRDRKVRVMHGASLYALCRSWLRNGFPEETQPQYGDVIKTLPRPLPFSVTDNLPKKAEDEEEEEGKEAQDEEYIEHLSAQDLLKKHIGRAKGVRARLRDERLKRIARYKTRLALLLPPLVEQVRNDNAVGT